MLNMVIKKNLGMVGEKWMFWTVLEGLGKTGVKILQKLVGVASTAYSHAFLATFIVGFVQLLIGGAIAGVRRKALFSPRQHVWGSIFYGIAFTISTIVTFVVFLLGGDMGVNTFI